MHNITFVAWDTLGNVYTARRDLTTAYSYSEPNCPYFGRNNPPPDAKCGPGIVTQSPQPNDFVGNSFDLKASVQNNTDPITTMIAYLDWTQIAKSTGPTLYQTINNAPSGSHFLTIQAWDTTGKLYRVQYNININVPH